MRFLSTLFWVLLAVIVVLFGSRNWNDVTLNLWGDIQADVKIPVLLLVMFLIGPIGLFLVGAIWSGLFGWLLVDETEHDAEAQASAS